MQEMALSLCRLLFVRWSEICFQCLGLLVMRLWKVPPSSESTRHYYRLPLLPHLWTEISPLFPSQADDVKAGLLREALLLSLLRDEFSSMQTQLPLSLQDFHAHSRKQAHCQCHLIKRSSR